LVVIEHQFGYSTRYAHNSKFVVRAGDRIKRGQIIALMGMTGKASGPHSHYEVWHNSRRENPFPYLNKQLLSTATSKTLTQVPADNAVPELKAS